MSDDAWTDRQVERARRSVTDDELFRWSVELTGDGYAEWTVSGHVRTIRVMSRRLRTVPSKLPESLETMTIAYGGRNLTASTRRAYLLSLDLWHDRADARANK